MKQLPNRVPVGALRYQVKQVSQKDPIMRSRDTPTFGFCDDEACILYIAKELSPQMKWATLAHEWVHAQATGYKQLDITEGEDTVETMSREILRLFRYLTKE